MISDLEVTNGILELKFDPYTYFYTVIVDDEVTSLEFSYNLAPDYFVEIKNNSLFPGENIVYLDVYSVDEEVTYLFYVYKEDADYISTIDNYMKSVEVEEQKSVDLYKVQLLSISIFIITIIVFSLIFRKVKR